MNTLTLIVEHGISLFVGHPAYVEAGAQVKNGFGGIIKKRVYWHEYTTGEEAIAAAVQAVADALGTIGARRGWEKIAA